MLRMLCTARILRACVRVGRQPCVRAYEIVPVHVCMCVSGCVGW